MTSHAKFVRHELIWTGSGCSPLARKAELFLCWKPCFSFTSNRTNSPRSIHLLKHLINQLKELFIVFRLLGRYCYCRQASQTVMSCVFMTDSWKMLHIHVVCQIFLFSYSRLLSLTSNIQTHTTPLPHSLYIPPSIQTWCVCVFGVVTARILQHSAHIPFIPDPPGVGPACRNHCPSVRESDRCRVWQMVGKSVVK